MIIPKDKIGHFMAGLAIAVVAACCWLLVSKTGTVDMTSAWLAALIASTVAGVVKEVSDYLDNKVHNGMHGVEVLDALATTAGSAPVVAALVIWGAQ